MFIGGNDICDFCTDSVSFFFSLRFFFLAHKSRNVSDLQSAEWCNMRKQWQPWQYPKAVFISKLVVDWFFSFSHQLINWPVVWAFICFTLMHAQAPSLALVSYLETFLQQAFFSPSNVVERIRQALDILHSEVCFHPLTLSTHKHTQPHCMSAISQS